MTTKKDGPPPSRRARGDGEEDDGAEPEPDPTLQTALDHAAAPYQGKIPEELLASMLQDLGDALATHPVASRYLARAKPPIVQRSGTRAKDEGAADDDAPEAKKGSAS